MSRRIGGVCLTVVVLHWLLAGSSTLGDQPADTAGLDDRIKAICKDNDPDTVRQLIADVEATGKEHKDGDYYRHVVALCEALNSWAPTDRRRSEMAWRLAMDAINADGEKPLACEAKLLSISQFGSDGKTVVPPGTSWQTEAELRGPDWPKGRLRRLNQALAVWQRIQTAKQNLPAVIGPIEITMWPPSGVPNAYENMDPKEIEDPVLRQQYEKACRENSKRARLANEKRMIEILELGFRFPTKCYLVGAYSKAPFDTQELEKSLAASSLDEKFVSEVVGEVKQRVAQRVDLEAKMASQPPTVQIVEIPPPGTEVYHSDLRLRQKINFNLHSPHIEDLLTALHEGSGVRLTRADSIQNEYPARGGLLVSGVPAWKIMDQIRGFQQVQGRWIADRDGYRLVSNGQPVLVPETPKDWTAQAPTVWIPMPASPRQQWQRAARVIALPFAIAIAGTVAYWLQRRRRLAI